MLEMYKYQVYKALNNLKISIQFLKIFLGFLKCRCVLRDNREHVYIGAPTYSAYLLPQDKVTLCNIEPWLQWQPSNQQLPSMKSAFESVFSHFYANEVCSKAKNPKDKCISNMHLVHYLLFKAQKRVEYVSY